MQNNNTSVITRPNDPPAIAMLADSELDLVAAGGGLDLHNLVNLNIAVSIQNGLNIAVLNKNVAQSVIQITGINQIITG